MKIQIQPATVDDASDACNLIRSSILECCGDDHGASTQVLQEWLRNKAPEALRELARLDGATVGYASSSGTGEVMPC